MHLSKNVDLSTMFVYSCHFLNEHNESNRFRHRVLQLHEETSSADIHFYELLCHSIPSHTIHTYTVPAGIHLLITSCCSCWSSYLCVYRFIVAPRISLALSPPRSHFQYKLRLSPYWHLPNTFQLSSLLDSPYTLHTTQSCL